MLCSVMESLHAARQEAGRCYVTKIPDTIPLSDLDPQTHSCHGKKSREEKEEKIIFSLLAAQQRQHLLLPAPDSAKLSFHHLIVYTASPRRHTKKSMRIDPYARNS